MTLIEHIAADPTATVIFVFLAGFLAFSTVVGVADFWFRNAPTKEKKPVLEEEKSEI